jgi:hypothetical protein
VAANVMASMQPARRKELSHYCGCMNSVAPQHSCGPPQVLGSCSTVAHTAESVCISQTCGNISLQVDTHTPCLRSCVGQNVLWNQHSSGGVAPPRVSSTLQYQIVNVNHKRSSTACEITMDAIVNRIRSLSPARHAPVRLPRRPLSRDEF